VTTIQLQQNDAKVLSVALLYHLGRPGSEVDQETRGPHPARLKPVLDAIQGQVGQPVVTIEASAGQVLRIGQALSGLSNEMRQFGLSGDSVIPGLKAALADVWPEVVDDPAAAADLVQFPVMLRRRLDAVFVEAEQELAAERAAAEAERRARRGRWWQVWRR